MFQNPVIRMTIRLAWPHKNLNLFEKTRSESGNSYKLQFVEVGPVAEPHAGFPRWDAPPDKVLQVLTIRSKHFNIPSIQIIFLKGYFARTTPTIQHGLKKKLNDVTLISNYQIIIGRKTLTGNKAYKRSLIAFLWQIISLFD